MSKIHKIEMYVVDANDLMDRDYTGIPEVLDRYTDMNGIIINGKTVEFEWDDDLAINRVNCPLEEYEKYLEKDIVMKCELCSEEQDVFYIYRNNEGEHILRLNGGWNEYWDGFDYAEIEIQYCPKCGRKL